MAYSGWNGGGMPHQQSPQWQQPHGSAKKNPTVSTKLPAIGSERRQTTSSTSNPSRSSPISQRPPSWQDEIGGIKSRSPESFGAPLRPYESEGFYPTHSTQIPPKPYNIDNLNGKGNKSRSSSTPASEAVRPSAFGSASRLRHLSMSTSVGQNDPNEASRRAIRLTKSPTEFVPSSVRHNMSRHIPEEVVAEQSAEEFAIDDMVKRHLPYSPSRYPQGFQKHVRQLSANTMDPEDNKPVAKDYRTDFLKPKDGPPRIINFQELRHQIGMPPPRPGSPDEDLHGADIAEYADRVLNLRNAMAPAMEKPEPIYVPQVLADHYNSPEFLEEEREELQARLKERTPASAGLADTLGVSPYTYQMLKMRDTVRRTIPNSMFPFFKNNGEIDDDIFNYPPEVQEAFFNPPVPLAYPENSSDKTKPTKHPGPKSQFVVVTFKHFRAEVFLHSGDMAFDTPLKIGELVVVQADRGENVGQVWHICDSMVEAEQIARNLNTDQLNNLLGFTRKHVAQAQSMHPLTSNYKCVSQPSWVLRRADNQYLMDLQRKEHDETKAKRIAAQKADDMGFPLEILDTEFQIDHQKLTIYYISSEYVRFKELVNNIYKIYKMRIWMSSINPQHPPEVSEDTRDWAGSMYSQAEDARQDALVRQQHEAFRQRALLAMQQQQLQQQQARHMMPQMRQR